MLKTPMPNVAGMTDTLEFVKNLWGGMNIPGMPAMTGPSLSTEELDKKIADLKAVEAWLNLNIGMLRGTIQALEVQRGTLAALKAMGENMAQAMGKAGSEATMAPFTQFFGQAAQGAAAQPPSPPPSAPPQPEPDSGAPGGAGAAMPAAVAWWNLLQDQFRQAVASTMPPDSKGADGKAAGSPGDVSGGAAKTEPPSGEPVDASPTGNTASGRGARSPRSKADKA